LTIVNGNIECVTAAKILVRTSKRSISNYIMLSTSVYHM